MKHGWKTRMDERIYFEGKIAERKERVLSARRMDDERKHRQELHNYRMAVWCSSISLAEKDEAGVQAISEGDSPNLD